MGMEMIILGVFFGLELLAEACSFHSLALMLSVGNMIAFLFRTARYLAFA